MSLLKPHVAAMKQGLYPSLSAISDALSNPAALNGPGLIATVFAGVVAWPVALKRFIADSNALATHVFEAEECPGYSRAAFTHEFDRAVLELIAAYADLLQVAREEPGPRAKMLERVARSHLESVAMWLADIVLILNAPEWVWMEGDGTKDFNIRFTYPDTPEELDAFVIQPTRYDSAYLREALGIASYAPLSLPPGRIPERVCQQQITRPPKRNSGLSSFLWGALFGAVIFDWFDDD